MRARLKLALSPADPRQALRLAVEHQGESLAALSRMIDRSPGYLARFINDGRPIALTERDHGLLGAYLGTGTLGLGIRDLWARS